ncbi:tetratricopeptide repeat protein [Thiocystis violacea]|uniref:tetratricopeptide repeat protein n=1 Tax=Thiocystis violacea TaxID=13725 RepID=UPI001906AA24|nr:sel1 repeat family protein [Thiocystis violacea]MBK1718642.1 hypothetical protein [Thiocystis violacea]
MPSISLSTASSITGLTKRTLWRHIEHGSLSSISAREPGEKTRVRLEDVLPLACLPLEPEDHAVILEADGGDAVAQCDLALMFLAADRPADAVPWLTLAAKPFYPDAMCYLGRGYLSGAGVARDEEAGLMWLSHAATKGHPLAQALTRFLQSPAGQQRLAAQDQAALDAALDAVERQVLLKVMRETADPA